MKKSLFFILSILIVMHSALADNEAVGLVIQRQSKQIQELTNKLQELENTVADLKLTLKSNVLLANRDSHETVSDHNSSNKEVANDATRDQNNSRFLNKNLPNDRPAEAQSEKSEYELALASLKDGKFEEAEKAFAHFIAKYPSSMLQSNAVFWYAESFYRREMFKESAVHYQQCYKTYPKGSKAADSLLKLSYSLAGLNKQKEACNMLLKLEQEFPERPIESIKRAGEAKDKFHCK